ncbi:alpha/beta hydrolase [Flavobacterium tructae]|uniref:alpha/beta hydrolase n=1 Tax=Flavobacterium tructae TaxID=1114873 RepID=UPI002551F640|nr:alpha/beta hydrolase [Flavobacterium tructae]MDL2141687.1 alpha/beta hydrolase [Flavobacterium tructae]
MSDGLKNGKELPEIDSWRQRIKDFGLMIAITPTEYDDKVLIKDLYTDAQNEQDKLRLRFYYPIKREAPAPVLYWMHGGGMIVGAPEQDDIQMKQIAAETGAVVVSVDYRLAPEYPFPVPLQDVYSGLNWIISKASDLGIDSNKIAVGGASAGGGLAASLVQKVLQESNFTLVHQSLTYPMLDNRNISNSSKEITSLGIWDRHYNLFAWKQYLGIVKEDQEAPLFSVPALSKNLAGLPSTFIAVGALDLFRDEDIEYGLRLMEAGVDTELHFYHGAVHGFDFHIPDNPMTKGFLTKRINALKLAFSNR